MEFEPYFEKRLNEVHEIFSEKQIDRFVQQCIDDAKSRVSHKDFILEDELKIRRGSLKYFPSILSKNDVKSKEHIKTEKIFYRIIKNYTVDFDDELRKLRLYYEQNPQEIEYNIYYLSNDRFESDQLLISNKKDRVVFKMDEGEYEFDLYDGRQFNIIIHEGERKEIKLDRPINEKLEEIICGQEDLIGDDKTLIRTSKIVLVHKAKKLDFSQLENIALYLVNNDLQRTIYPQDIFTIINFNNEVNRFRRNNRWIRIIMPKVLVDAYIKYLYHFKSYVFEEKNVIIEINIVENPDSIILQISSSEITSDYVINEWLEEFVSYLFEKKSDFSNIKDDIVKEKVKLQRSRFYEDVLLEESRYGKNYEIYKMLELILNEIREDRTNFRNLIIYGGNQQFADQIFNKLEESK